MPLGGSGTAWGNAVNSSVVDDSDLNASEKAQVLAFWQAVCVVHANHIVVNSVIQTISGAPDGEHVGQIQ